MKLTAFYNINTIFGRKQKFSLSNRNVKHGPDLGFNMSKWSSFSSLAKTSYLCIRTLAAIF